MNVRRIAETQTTITVEWDRPVDQVGYVPTIDGSDKLTDGKRHPAYGPTAAQQTQVRIGKPADETNPATKHSYGVMILDVGAQGEWSPDPLGWKAALPIGPLADRNGGNTQPQWRFDYSVGPLTVEKQYIHDYTSYGYGLMQWPAQPSPPGVRSKITDLHVKHISRNPPRSSDGTAEADLWVGQTADVMRVLLESAAWMQIWTGARHYNSGWSDVTMRDTQLVGWYPEHNTWDTTMTRSVNEYSPAQLANTNNVEWWYGGEGSKNLTWDLFDYYVPKNSYAFFIDAGNGGCIVGPRPGCRVWGPGNIAAFPNNIVSGLGPNVITLANIDMSELEGNKNVYYHSNPIGTFTQRVAAATRGFVGLAPKLDPATIRFSTTHAERMEELARSA